MARVNGRYLSKTYILVYSDSYFTVSDLRPFSTRYQRSYWLDRLTLNLEYHLKRRGDAVYWCVRALIDCPDGLTPGGRLQLQMRLAKISPGIAVSMQPRARLMSGAAPREVYIECATLRKDIGDNRQAHFLLPGSGGGGEAVVASVEEVALRELMQRDGFLEGRKTHS